MPLLEPVELKKMFYLIFFIYEANVLFYLVISVELPLLEDPLQGALGKLTIWNKLTGRVGKIGENTKSIN